MNSSLIDSDSVATFQVTVYMGEGWYYDFKHTHFDMYSPPDFYTRVSRRDLHPCIMLSQ